MSAITSVISQRTKVQEWADIPSPNLLPLWTRKRSNHMAKQVKMHLFGWIQASYPKISQMYPTILLINKNRRAHTSNTLEIVWKKVFLNLRETLQKVWNLIIFKHNRMEGRLKSFIPFATLKMIKISIFRKRY